MKAMVLSAGVGLRMLPLSLSLPKAAMPVLGRPLAVQILHRLALNGVTEAVLNLHHLGEVIQRVLREGANPGLPTVHYTREAEILGTAGGIRAAAHLLRGGEPFVVRNSDFLADIDLAPVLEAHRRSGCLATLVLAPSRPGYSAVEVDGAGRVVSLAGEPPADPSRVAGTYLFTGCHILEEEVLSLIPAAGPSDIRDVYRDLAARGRLGSYLHDGFWWEFGSPELYLEGSLRLLDCPSARLQRISGAHDALRIVDGAVAAVGPGAGIDPSARFGGRVALGFASQVSEDASLQDSVVMPEAWIGPGCRLKRTVVGQGVELPAGLESEEELICADPGRDTPLPPSTRRQNGLLVYSFS